MARMWPSPTMTAKRCLLAFSAFIRHTPGPLPMPLSLNPVARRPRTCQYMMPLYRLNRDFSSEGSLCRTGGICAGACCRYQKCAHRSTTARRSRAVVERFPQPHPNLIGRPTDHVHASLGRAAEIERIGQDRANMPLNCVIIRSDHGQFQLEHR